MNFLDPYGIIEIPLLELMRNLAIGLVIAAVWAFVVGKATRLIVDTRQYLPMFLLLIPSMILIISIIKSSIALSLGLVGALSIVRFRTPIKEPEELLYIFIAIAVGLGLGANQVLPTLIGFGVIALAFLPFALNKSRILNTQSNIVEIIFNSGDDREVNVARVEEILKSSKFRYRVKRVLVTEGTAEILLQASGMDTDEFEHLRKRLRDDIGTPFEISITDNARVIT